MSTKQIQRFLELRGFFQSFISNLASIIIWLFIITQLLTQRTLRLCGPFSSRQPSSNGRIIWPQPGFSRSKFTKIIIIALATDRPELCRHTKQRQIRENDRVLLFPLYGSRQ